MADTINNHVAAVQALLGNRADLSSGAPSRIANWLKSALIELCFNNDFAEIEGSIQSQLTPGLDTYVYPPTMRKLKSIAIYVGQAGSQNSIVPDYKDMKTIRQFSPTDEGVPGVVCDQGNKLIFRPVPDQPYDMVWDGILKPVISANVVDTVVNLPDDWLEILEYSAAIRGHSELLENDKLRAKMELLFGFKTDTGKSVPGLVTNRQTRRQAQASMMDYGLQPRNARRSYT